VVSCSETDKTLAPKWASLWEVYRRTRVFFTAFLRKQYNTVFTKCQSCGWKKGKNRSGGQTGIWGLILFLRGGKEAVFRKNGLP